MGRTNATFKACIADLKNVLIRFGTQQQQSSSGLTHFIRRFSGNVRTTIRLIHQKQDADWPDPLSLLCRLSRAVNSPSRRDCTMQNTTPCLAPFASSALFALIETLSTGPSLTSLPLKTQDFLPVKGPFCNQSWHLAVSF